MSKDDLDSTKVVCIVDDETKSIYLWKGSQAGVRKKFIGARVATNLRTEYGFNFKVRPLDEGEEPPTFFTALEGTTAAIKVMKPGDKAPPPRPPKPKDKVEAAPAETVTTSPPTPKTSPTITAPQPKTTAAPPPKPPVTATRPAATTAAPKASGSEIDMMIKELEAQDPPEGYQRELLIIYNELYTVSEHKMSVFGQEKIERRFEKVKDPPEGTFMAEGFIPRVIVKDGKVLGIELLKGTPDAILSPIKTEMKERLGDLISFFKSEVEEEDKKPSTKKTTKKRKLVAK
ncbi:MAG: hypothetical protein KAQ65_02470 [Candidatus Thorarchaeota archaeon]|nr:hypothetical protein [Candidatus Thorarchaeota archaeon]